MNSTSKALKRGVLKRKNIVTETAGKGGGRYEEQKRNKMRKMWEKIR